MIISFLYCDRYSSINLVLFIEFPEDDSEEDEDMAEEQEDSYENADEEDAGKNLYLYIYIYIYIYIILRQIKEPSIILDR